MSEMINNHTPGPWEIACDVEDYGVWRSCFKIFSKKGPARGIARTVQQWDGAEEAANAMLINAAPDLLSAIEEIIMYSGGADTVLEDENVMQRVMDAYYKAKGNGKEP